MNIESLLEQIEEILDSGTKIAMTHKCAVNADAIKTCIEDIRLNMPEEISQAKAIVADRSAILSKAKNDAVSSVTKAQDKAHELMANTEAKTEQMLSAAKATVEKNISESEERAAQTVAKAEAEAAAMIENARKTAEKLIDEHEITAQARAYAAQLKKQSQDEASDTINTAVARAEEMLANASRQAEDITSTAKADADEMLARAKKWSTEMKDAASTFADRVMTTADRALVNSVNEIRNARQALRDAGRGDAK